MGVGTRRYDDRNKPALCAFVVIVTLAAWVIAVLKTYVIPAGYEAGIAFWYAALATPADFRLWIPPALAFTWALAVFLVIISYTTTHFGLADYVARLRGTRIASAPQLRDECRELGKKQLRLMSIPVPIAKENLHFEAVGGTGSGKSQVIEDYIQSALERGDRMIVIDPNGGFMSKFFQPGDVVLNPFDARGQAWTIFNEIQTPYDVEQFSVSLIPKSPSTEHEQWNAMARTIVSSTMLKLMQLGKGNTEQLVYWLVQSSNDELRKMLSDTVAAGVFHGAEETLGSIRTVLTRYVTAHKYLQDPVKGEVPYSIRTWLQNGVTPDHKGNLWVTWREDMLPAQKPLIACWVDVICASSLSSDVENAQDIHLVLDELDSLDKLNYLNDAATKGRKHLLKIFCGFQSYAQLDSTFGKDDALTLRGSLRNSVSLAVAEKDTYTAKQISEALGQHTVTRRRFSTSIGTAGGRGSTSLDSETEFVVQPSDVHTLPDLTGYVKIAGDVPLARVSLTYKKRPIVTEALIVIDNKWTQPIAQQPRRFSAPAQ
jgi:type IV secretory pathway TraG/TraD family ATPase VirD4